MQYRPMSYLAASLLMAASISAQAEVTPQPAAKAKTTAVSAAGEAEQKICRKLKVSGTRFAEKVCLTKSQWQKVESES